ncbi:hypothetical protein HanRHA438_Chr05g0226441 [Helianthus annuus]|nr:hypothetical protein HanIR_Chr05g0233561 [Helianthus annuus]KAJ0919161.1 hypothetical protein HanRHA438_Chr05g0226441 [Helianthus annuus]
MVAGDDELWMRDSGGAMMVTGTVEMVAGQFTGKEAAPEKLAGTLAGDRKHARKIIFETVCVYICI